MIHRERKGPGLDPLLRRPILPPHRRYVPPERRDGEAEEIPNEPKKPKPIPATENVIIPVGLPTLATKTLFTAKAGPKPHIQPKHSTEHPDSPLVPLTLIAAAAIMAGRTLPRLLRR